MRITTDLIIRDYPLYKIIDPNILTSINMSYIIEHIESYQCEVNRVESIYSDNARVFKAFCDETRLKVLSLLQSGEKCACILLEKVSISQPTLSHHMRILVDSGIVTARRDGKWTHYSISASGCENAVVMMKSLIAILESKNEGCCI